MEKTELREKKKGLFDEKKELLEKNGSVSEEMRKLRDHANELKKERDELNKFVQESKVERERANKEMKKVAPPQVDISIYGGLDRTDALKKQLEELEWKYQTSSLSPEADKKMAKSITELSELLKIANERDSIKKEVSAKRGASEMVRKEHKAFHLNVLRYADDSEKKHKQLMETYRKGNAPLRANRAVR